MLNLIPALLLFLAGGPFGPPNSDACARLDSLASRALVVQLARELERAGLGAAHAALVMASCDDKSTEPSEERPKVLSVFIPPCPELGEGFSRSVRSRDGPACDA